MEKTSDKLLGPDCSERSRTAVWTVVIVLFLSAVLAGCQTAGRYAHERILEEYALDSRAGYNRSGSGAERRAIGSDSPIGLPEAIEIALAGNPGIKTAMARMKDDTELVVGPPAGRRALLDRFAFLLDPATLQTVRTYQRTLRQRNAALSAGASDAELDAWDERLAAAAARLLGRRRQAFAALAPDFAATYRRLRGSGFPEVTLDYRGESWLNDPESSEIVEESYQKRYNATRLRDRQAGHSLEGPHRHDVRIEADDQPAKEVLSSGQIKVVAAALRLATVLHVERQRSDQLPVMVDDVDAELDNETFARLAGVLAGGRQLLLTSAHPEVVAPAFPEASILVMAGGSCRGPAGSGE